MMNFSGLTPEECATLMKDTVDCDSCPIKQKCEEWGQDKKFVNYYDGRLCYGMWLRYLYEEGED